MTEVADDIAATAMEAAGLGGWQYDPATMRITWTPVTFQIHDLEPGEPPSLDSALTFYPPAARLAIETAMQQSITNGTSWDLEVPMVTAKGRRIWVRACGQAIRKGGRTVGLAGALQDVTKRRELTELADRLSVVARQMTNAIIMTDPEGRTEWLNDAFVRLTGFDIEDMRGRKPGDLLQGPQTDPQTIRHISESLARGEGFEVEIINYNRDRQPYWIAVTCTPLRDEQGRLTGFIAVESDVSARRAAEDKMRAETAERQRAEALLRDILDALPSAVSAYDPKERLILVNRAFRDMLPIKAAFAKPGQTLTAITRAAAEAGQFPDAGPSAAERERWIEATLVSHRTPGASFVARLEDGRFVLAQERHTDAGNLVCVRTDATELKRAESELRVQAERDPLTMLANRNVFMRKLLECLDEGEDPEARRGALLLFDIDYFKQINDTLGHDVGDALLVEVGERLRHQSRAGDMAARLGGDEFAVILPGLADPPAVAVRMNAIQAALARPLALGGRSLTISTSGGVTLFPQDANDAQRLLKNADLALYEAKRGGRARWCAFRREQAVALDRQARLSKALREALAGNAILVAFQPKRLLRGSHAGFEIFARWQDGAVWVPPGEFVPIAEESGQMVPLGRAIMDAALARLRVLIDAGLRPGRLALNVSAPQLLDQAFVADTLAALARYGLEPADLELEVTETVLLGRARERVEALLGELKGLGITLALDDFGTGFASLAHLSRLPIDRLKIDRSFVAEIGLGGRGEVIVRSVIGLARSLGIESVAEGVETHAQLDFLAAEGCDAAQGYLLSRPLLSTDEAVAYLRAQCAPGQPVRHLIGSAQ